MTEKYDSSYLHFIAKLDKEYPPEECDLSQLYEIINRYGKEYMLRRDVWDAVVYILFFHAEPFWGEKLRKEISQIAHYQFCINEEILSEECCNIPYKLLHRKEDCYFDRDICLPHADLDFSLDKYEKTFYSQPPKEIYDQYKKSKALFEKIMSVESDDEKWIEALKEADDDLFVRQNIEYRIGRNMLNKKLWKLYIAYLKDHNPTTMLHTYSKYCRFWLDDEMKKEYESQVKIYGPISVAWTNLLYPQKSFLQNIITKIPWLSQQNQTPFETQCNISDVIQSYPRIYSRISISRNDSWDWQYFKNARDQAFPILYYNKNGLIFQHFPFHQSYINYILQNANGNVLQKLYMSCKEFFSKKQKLICYNIKFLHHPDKPPLTFLEESIRICNDTPEKYFSDKSIIIKNRFTNPQNLSSFISKIYKCEAKFMEIYYQKISVKEFEILTKHGTVEELVFMDFLILHDDGKSITLEEMLKMLLNIRIFECYDASNGFYTSQTSQSLYEIPFKNKIQRFIIWDVDVQFDPHEFAKFVKLKAASNCKLKIMGPSFDVRINPEFRKQFYKIVQHTIRRNWKASHRPLFTFEESKHEEYFSDEDFDEDDFLK